MFQFLLGRKRFYFVGIETTTIELYKKLAIVGEPEVVFVDNRYAGQELIGSKVLSIEEMVTDFGLNCEKSILLYFNSNPENAKLLKKLNENKQAIIFPYTVFEKRYLSIWFLINYGIGYADFIGHPLNYRCTLRCKNCSASIPYIKKEKPQYDQIVHEIDRLFSLIDYVSEYDLTGGETFLAMDDLANTIEYLIENYGKRIGKILIYSNATVVPSDNITKCLNHYKDRFEIEICVSNYETVEGWTEKYKRFEEHMTENNIKFSLMNQGSWIDMGWKEYNNHFDEEQIKDFFNNCYNFCNQINDGRIFYCTHGHNADLTYYNYGDTERESLDLFNENLSKEDVVLFLSGYLDKGYLDVCQNCRGWGSINRERIPVAEQLERTNN